MKHTFSARIWQEGDWFVAQCLDIEIASQGETESEALANLTEALELHFEPPQATILPTVQKIELRLVSLKPLPYREVKRKLEAADFVVVSQKGSHVKFSKLLPESRRTAIVPRHKEGTTGTLRSILAQAGLTPDEFDDL